MQERIRPRPYPPAHPLYFMRRMPPRCSPAPARSAFMRTPANDHGGGASWAAWLGWGVNAITLALCAVLFVSYLRHRKESRRKAASHLTVCLASFAVVAATTAWTVF